MENDYFETSAEELKNIILTPPYLRKLGVKVEEYLEIEFILKIVELRIDGVYLYDIDRNKIYTNPWFSSCGNCVEIKTEDGYFVSYHIGRHEQYIHLLIPAYLGELYTNLKIVNKVYRHEFGGKVYITNESLSESMKVR